MYVFSGRKEASDMGTEAERQDTRKAMAYDLKKIIRREPARQSFTPEEVEKLIDDYIETADQK